MESSTTPRRVIIVDDSRTIQAMLDNAFSLRPDFRVVGFCSDAGMAAEMVRRLMPDVVTIDLAMPYLDGAALLDMIGDLHSVCKIIVSDTPLKNLLLFTRLVEAGAATCLGKQELASNPKEFFKKINAAVRSVQSRKQNVLASRGAARAKQAAPAIGPIERPTLPFPIPADETERLAIIRRMHLCSSERERQFDLITAHVAKVTAFPVCLLTFIDKDVQWIKSASGLEIDKTAREVAFCNYTIAQGGPFVVSNAAADERFANNDLVTGPPSIRCYAGHPISLEGVQVGALCVIDNRIRTVSKHVLDQLSGLSGIIAELIEHRYPVAA